MKKYVWTFINNLKLAVGRRKDNLNFKILDNRELEKRCVFHVILCDQRLHFPDILSYFSTNSKQISKIHNLASQLNIYKDAYGLLCAKTKSKCWKEDCSEFTLLMFENIAT